MERLTKRIDGEAVFYDCKGLCGTCEKSICTGFSPMAKRLAAYEDTMPLERIQELAQAEKDGRLVVPPCKVGDTVYATFRLCGDYLREKNKPYPCEVIFIGISSEPFMHIQFENGRVFPVGFEKIGETVFTTKEAAEAALNEREAAHGV